MAFDAVKGRQIFYDAYINPKEKEVLCAAINAPSNQPKDKALTLEDRIEI